MPLKRVWVWALLALMVLSLIGCGKDEDEQTTPVLPTQKEEREEQRADRYTTVEQPGQEEETEPSTGGNAGSATAKPSGTTGTASGGKAYYIRINLTCCTVNIYEKDEEGNYTIPIKAMVCSTGTATPTSGVYRIGSRWEWLRLQGNVYGYYVTQITGNILFHSVPYLRKGDPSSLEYWEFDKLGQKASLGCIRLQVCDALWIYNNAGNIAGVEFYHDEDPGPLGKPSAPKISENELCRDWDPTDPNPENPWLSAETDAPQERPEDEELPQDGETPSADEPLTGEETTPPQEETKDAPPDEGEAAEDAELSEETADETAAEE